MSVFRKICSAAISAFVLFEALLSSAYSANREELVYSHKENEKMMIALTFDDGPHPRYTPEILDILKEFGIHATFFAVGVNVKNYPTAIQRCVSEGHEIANHTYTHMNLSEHTVEDICHEVSSAEDVIYEHLEVRPKLLRPPGGLYGTNVIKAASSLDYTVVLWNIDTRDWAHTPAETIAQKVLAGIHPGDIILMHDYIGKDSPTPSALRIILPKLIDEGYNFVTVSELLECDGTD